MLEGTASRPPLDLSQCDSEPIHIPNAIQPHGALIAVLADRLVVTHASTNLAATLGLSAQTALGMPVDALLGEAAHRMLVDVALNNGPDGTAETAQLQITDSSGARPLQLHAYRTGRHVGVDIQPILPKAAPGPNDTLLRSALEKFARATHSAELCELAVLGLKALTGYDRVMAYRLHPDGHGEVIAEAREPQLEPFLGLHYPAADIPPQSRQLFLRQRICLIADTSYSPVPLLSDPRLDDGTPLDLTLSCLRSVSPVHREYLRNMRVAASLSVALVQSDERHAPTLWGMFVCHGETPRIAGPELQAVVVMIGQVVSILLRSLDEAQIYRERLRRNATLRGLADRIALRGQLPNGMAAAEAELQGLVGATGALINIAGAVTTLGDVPPPSLAARALATLRAEAGGDVVAIDDLGLRHPELGGCISAGSGALLIPLPQTVDSAILWFRPERVRAVSWGGNPHHPVSKDAASGRLSPRGSFAAWTEIEAGHCEPWTAADVAIARELRELVELAVADRTRADLARLRHYDPLTALPNRILLDERMRADQQSAATGRAMLFLDLDGFKAVNDSMGHPAGDALLIEVARRLRAATGPGDTVARLGGDEFVVLCEDPDLPSAITLGEQIRLAIEAPIDIDGRQCRVSSSIGIAAAGKTGGLDLIRAADMAMYAAKQAGGNRILLFEPSLFDRASMQFQLEDDMRVALGSSDQFVLLYQPIFSVTSRTRRLDGFEALVRWRHPRHGWMSPALFIPLAEKSGLILPLGDWVLKTALHEGNALRNSHPAANLTMSVNVSVAQLLQSGYCASVAAALEAEDYPPRELCLEVVESMLADAAVAAVLADIRKLGVQVAIDDFGIGFSSLSYLRRLPVDMVKLDRSFLEDVEDDPRGIGFIGAVIALAHAAGKPVIFEGIETKAQLEIALGAGTDRVQGFLFAPPLSAAAAVDLVASTNPMASVNAGESPLLAKPVKPPPHPKVPKTRTRP